MVTSSIQVGPELLADVLCLPDGVDVEWCSVSQTGLLILHVSGADPELIGKECRVIFTKHTDRQGRFMVTSKLEDVSS